MNGSIVSAIASALDSLNYTSRNNVRIAPNSNKHADIVGFGSRVPSQKSACIAGQHIITHSEEEVSLREIGQIGVRYAYLFNGNGIGRLWRMDANATATGYAPAMIEAMPVEHITNYLTNNRDKYVAESVLEEKIRSASTSNAQTLQLSFASAGLFDFREEQTEQSLIKLVNGCVADALKYWATHNDLSNDASSTVGSALLRLIAARALVDKGICNADVTSRNATVLSTVLNP